MKLYKAPLYIHWGWGGHAFIYRLLCFPLISYPLEFSLWTVANCCYLPNLSYYPYNLFSLNIWLRLVLQVTEYFQYNHLTSSCYIFRVRVGDELTHTYKSHDVPCNLFGCVDRHRKANLNLISFRYTHWQYITLKAI